jgi:hypothetical protein
MKSPNSPAPASLARYAARWIGGALLLALVIVGLGTFFLPEVDLLALRYAVW